MKALFITALLALAPVAQAHDVDHPCCCCENTYPSKRLTIEGKVWRHYHSDRFYQQARKIRLEKMKQQERDRERESGR